MGELAAALSTDGGEDAARATSIVRLQSALGNPVIPESFAEIRSGVYLDALADIPAWAVEAAAMRWIRGAALFEGDNPLFVPKPVQLIRLARAIMEPLENQASRLTFLAATAEKDAAAA
ncbi:MAG: hypothetical protein A3E78_07485 [Alphaproteobacteria bacterium RIFCSPHIGHO2_12_FULL_63_12]|nr:MAG: hypothetical protein A3E78_07485 [Alphaproteobacteria bacterium RIFCSPHIGHO2_12_FULL_63_12]